MCHECRDEQLKGKRTSKRPTNQDTSNRPDDLIDHDVDVDDLADPE